MPKRKSVNTLQFLCFKTAVREPETLNNLELLPNTVLNDMYEQKKELNLSVRPLPEVFINGITFKLNNLEEFSPNDNLDLFVLDRVANISKNLNYLNLEDSLGIQPHQLIVLVREVRQITTLKLGNTRCNDHVLAAIGEYSDNIQNLSLCDCEDITDDGIALLCVDPKTSISRNKRITQLNLTNTQTEEGGFVVAIKMLRELREVFGGTDINEAAIVFKDELAQNITYNLVSVPFTIITESDLKVASILFPKAYFLYITSDMDAWKDPDVVRVFQNLKKIVNQLYVCEQVTRNTVDLMVKNFNPNLSLVVIEECNLTDIYAICHRFPQLKQLVSFSLTPSGLNFSEFITVPRGFESLTVLGLDFNDIEVLENFLDVLFVNCKSLEEFGIRRCQMFTDMMVERVVKTNPFKFLRKLCLYVCNVITIESLRTFLCLDNPLRDIDILDCGNIGEHEISFLRSYVCEKNLEVKLRSDGNAWFFVR